MSESLRFSTRHHLREAQFSSN